MKFNIALTLLLVTMLSCKKTNPAKPIVLPNSPPTEQLYYAKCSAYFTSVKFYSLHNNSNPVLDSCVNFAVHAPPSYGWTPSFIDYGIDSIVINNVKLRHDLLWFTDTTNNFLPFAKTYKYYTNTISEDTVDFIVTKNIAYPIYLNETILPDVVNENAAKNITFKTGMITNSMYSGVTFEKMIDEPGAQYFYQYTYPINYDRTITLPLGALELFVNEAYPNTPPTDYYIIFVLRNWQKEIINGNTYYFVEEARYRKQIYYKN